MKHVFYIDPIEKLNTKKDSSLMLAQALQEQGGESYLLFEKDLHWGTEKLALRMHRFSAQWNGYYLQNFALGGPVEVIPEAGDHWHMRLDPPFDGRYLRYLWLLDQWERRGVKVTNRPRGIMQFNEKLMAYQRAGAVPSWVGEDGQAFSHFIESLKHRGSQAVVLKPLDLYSGLGVEKWDIDDPQLLTRFVSKAQELQGPIVAQAFIAEVSEGEVRSIYFKGEHLGSILKKPKPGDFISNIAQGASFGPYDLPESTQAQCREICRELAKEGVDWVAFDILGGVPTEVNITCPGLLVEVSHAHQKNLAHEIARRLN